MPSLLLCVAIAKHCKYHPRRCGDSTRQIVSAPLTDVKLCSSIFKAIAAGLGANPRNQIIRTMNSALSSWHMSFSYSCSSPILQFQSSLIRSLQERPWRRNRDSSEILGHPQSNLLVWPRGGELAEGKKAGERGRI